MPRILHLTKSAAGAIRAEIARAKGNEVCFIAEVAESGAVKGPRAVARGNRTAVLAAVREATWGTLVIHNHPSGALEPSDPDLSVAADLYAQGIGLAICDNEARELYVVMEPARENQLEMLDLAGIAATLAPDGPVARAHAGYEDRPTQRDMAVAIAARYNDGGVLVAEAGTGTGKSIAYLIPAVEWALRNRERTVVSTNTINLQEQLVTKDLPFLRAALGKPFRFALVKGRGNYISIRRAKLAMDTGLALVDGPAARELAALDQWIGSTKDGSIQDLPFTPSAEVWDEVGSDSDVCLRARCPHFEQCFYQKSRREAAGADILVVNHHLLFSDLAVRRAQGNWTAPAVLPPYRRVVLDEAHNVEDAATSHLGVAVSQRGLHRLLSRVDRRGKGVVRGVEERLKLLEASAIRAECLGRIEKSIRPDVGNAKQRAAVLFARLEEVLLGAPDGVQRLADGFAAEESWGDAVSPALHDLLLVLDRLARELDGLREAVLTDRRATEKLEEQLVEVSALAGRIRGQADGLRTALIPGDDAVALVRWLERRGGGRAQEPNGSGAEVAAGNVVVRAAPIELGDVLREALWEPVDTAILTSATLSTRDGFGFVTGRLGLDRVPRVGEQSYPSPFDFGAQTVVAIPTDLPGVRMGGRGAPQLADAGGAPRHPPAGRPLRTLSHDEATATVIRELAGLTDGGIFGLFTSYRALRNVAGSLRRSGTDGRWPLFVQGESPRGELIRRFTADGRGILLGVASFWEGVDVPGDPLRGLVLAKLPFRVPTEPLTAARMEALERDGESGFFHYMLPHAALRLKQGFGRLIRSTADRGVVVLLDGRVLEKAYGRYFLDSLPPAPVRTGSWTELAAGLEGFYDRPSKRLTAASSLEGTG
jgi:ATP-dependent DNA helicase DinG